MSVAGEIRKLIDKHMVDEGIIARLDVSKDYVRAVRWRYKNTDRAKELNRKYNCTDEKNDARRIKYATDPEYREACLQRRRDYRARTGR